VKSLGLKVGFWHVLRKDNKPADALASHALKGSSRRLDFFYQKSEEADSFIAAEPRAKIASIVSKSRS
jgi:hypothetical protein